MKRIPAINFAVLETGQMTDGFAHGDNVFDGVRFRDHGNVVPESGSQKNEPVAPLRHTKAGGVDTLEADAIADRFERLDELAKDRIFPDVR